MKCEGLSDRVNLDVRRELIRSNTEHLRVIKMKTIVSERKQENDLKMTRACSMHRRSYGRWAGKELICNQTTTNSIVNVDCAPRAIAMLSYLIGGQYQFVAIVAIEKIMNIDLNSQSLLTNLTRSYQGSMEPTTATVSSPGESKTGHN